MDWVLVSLVVAPVLAVAGMLFVLRVLARVGRDVQYLADRLESGLQPPPPDDEG